MVGQGFPARGERERRPRVKLPVRDRAFPIAPTRPWVFLRRTNPTMAASSLHYRPELDGLRAIAVVAVLLFHLEAGWLPGGFAGVDVFFVLSGYLVTSIIVRQYRAGTFRFSTFYQRRIARIFPAFLAMAITTLMAARVWYSSWDYAAAGSSFEAALLSLANFHQLSLGDYFQLSRDAQPLLHCWSLSLEEQFYLLFPVLLGLIVRTPPRICLLLTALLTLGSFGWCLHLTAVKPVHAFYLLPSRAWELLAGSLLALGSGYQAAPDGKLQRSLGLAGLAAVLLTGWVLQEGSHFPGVSALLPVLGTVVVIRFGRTGPAATFLSLRPLVLVGRLSYSLYLWHWPVYSFTDYTLLHQAPANRLILKLALTLLTATISYYCIEKPARTWLNQPRMRRPALLMLGISLALLAPLGHLLHRRHYLDASNSSHGILTIPHPHATGSLVLMGDSQGSMYGQMARDLAASRQLNLLVLSLAGEDPLAATQGPSSALHQHSLEVLRQTKPAVVLLACHWIYKLKDNPGRLATTLKAIRPHTGRIILLTQPPLLPPTASRESVRQGSRPPFFEDPAGRKSREELNHTVQSLAGDAIRVIDTDPFFVHPDGSLILLDDEGHSLFHDAVHLSVYGTRLIQPAVGAAMSQ